jgi:hypothetical protein
LYPASCFRQNASSAFRETALPGTSSTTRARSRRGSARRRRPPTAARTSGCARSSLLDLERVHADAADLHHLGEAPDELDAGPVRVAQVLRPVPPVAEQVPGLVGCVDVPARDRGSANPELADLSVLHRTDPPRHAR